ncbi:Uncharacterized membrane protein YphA, DoxX/SURF4 family [Marininema mesophilum]|uniref:Uncharacterized membrane protein YphA, DoxX/SURF4 family n=1 Tax=Marininema mesophilum TaxID=1048340 RepID=A0A1H2XSG9_9BACL|nr:DoxX family protein [Marininema mesophilum]SDW95740.1 Uncharacterized membrane protein YphA, DoxX/SURF4 family [Marininema mesophilum]
MNKVLKVVGWIGLLLVVGLFLQAGVSKLIGVKMAVEGFHKFGFPDWFRLVIGSLEVIGGIALLFRKYTRHGVALLSTIMIGAIISILMKGNAMDVMMPGITLAVLATIGTLRKPVKQGKSPSARKDSSEKIEG